MFSNCKLIHRLFSAYLSLQIGKGIVGVSCLWFIFFTEKCLLEIAYLFNYIDSFGKWNENNCNEWVSVCAKHLSLFSFRNTTITMSMKWKIQQYLWVWNGKLMILELALVVILIIFAWYARKYVLYLYFIYIAIILYLMWEYNCKISAFHVPRAHIPIIWLWMRTIRWIRGIEIQMLCNNDNNAKYFTTFEDTFYPPH